MRLSKGLIASQTKLVNLLTAKNFPVDTDRVDDTLLVTIQQDAQSVYAALSKEKIEILYTPNVETTDFTLKTTVYEPAFDSKTPYSLDLIAELMSALIR